MLRIWGLLLIRSRFRARRHVLPQCGLSRNALGEGLGNVYRNNSFGVRAATNGTFATFGAGRTMSTYAALDAAYGSSMNSVESDPLLTSPRSGNFALMADSPVSRPAMAAWTSVLSHTLRRSSISQQSTRPGEGRR
jgi:hypothetical protein